MDEVERGAGPPERGYAERPPEPLAPEAARASGAEVELGAREVVVLALGLGATVLLGAFLWPFLGAIITSGTLAILVYPAYAALRDRIGNANVAAFVGSALLFFLILLPLVGLSFALADQLHLGADRVTRDLARRLGPGGDLREWAVSVGQSLGLTPAQISEQIDRQLREIPTLLAQRAVGFLSGLGGWLFQGGVALFTLFFMLRDGKALVEVARWLLPLGPEYTDHLIGRAREVTYATMFGNVAVAVVQGILVGLAFWAAGLPAPTLWGTVAGVLSLLPVVGAPLVWVPAGILLLVHGHVARGTLLLLFGFLVVSSVDNLLRAILVSDRAQLHPLIVFFSVLGAILVFGGVGLFIGPVLFVLCLALIEAARLVLEPRLPAGGRIPRGELLLDRLCLGAAREAPAEEEAGTSAAPPEPSGT